jgi:hypothetical protein
MSSSTLASSLDRVGRGARSARLGAHSRRVWIEWAVVRVQRAWVHTRVESGTSGPAFSAPGWKVSESETPSYGNANSGGEDLLGGG